MVATKYRKENQSSFIHFLSLKNTNLAFFNCPKSRISKKTLLTFYLDQNYPLPTANLG